MKLLFDLLYIKESHKYASIVLGGFEVIQCLLITALCFLEVFLVFPDTCK